MSVRTPKEAHDLVCGVLDQLVTDGVLLSYQTKVVAQYCIKCYLSSGTQRSIITHTVGAGREMTEKNVLLDAVTQSFAHREFIIGA